jgi:sulfatase modifying factor 1
MPAPSPLQLLLSLWLSPLSGASHGSASMAAAACGPAVPGMACIPGGDFVRGADDGPEDARPRATVWLQTFWMDVHEVTVARYEACVSSGKCSVAVTNYSDFSGPRQPKVGVTWHQAVAFCAAHGLHLPTEAEWEKAARGTDGRTYPWGEAPATCELAVIADARGRSCGVPKRGSAPEKGRTSDVGARPPNHFGLYDMAGNAWEWVADWYSDSYAACGEACSRPDPRGPCDGASPCQGHRRRVVRGGSWYWPGSYATTTRRRAHRPSNEPYHHYGFRCAASLDEVNGLRAR